jgi:hypothetical protein
MVSGVSEVQRVLWPALCMVLRDHRLRFRINGSGKGHSDDHVLLQERNCLPYHCSEGTVMITRIWRQLVHRTQGRRT